MKIKQHLLVVVFPEQERAEAYRTELRRLPETSVIVPSRAVVAERDKDGSVHLQYTHFLARDGAFIGGTWGTLVGLLFLNPLFGIVAGAGLGAAMGEIGDFGIGKPFLRQLVEHMKPGSSALFVPVEASFVPEALETLQASGGVVLDTEMTHESELELAKKLDQLQLTKNVPSA